MHYDNIPSPPLILVVDDNEHATRRIEKTLVPQGYDIIVAYDGEQALKQAAETPPGLMVLNVLKGVNNELSDPSGMCYVRPNPGRRPPLESLS